MTDSSIWEDLEIPTRFSMKFLTPVHCRHFEDKQTEGLRFFFLRIEKVIGI